MSSKTTAPTLISAERAAEMIGVDVFDLAIALRSFATRELEAQTRHVQNGDERPNFGRFQRLLRAAEACEAAWDEVIAASDEATP